VKVVRLSPTRACPVARGRLVPCPEFLLWGTLGGGVEERDCASRVKTEGRGELDWRKSFGESGGKG
jgi:hypothetical protein